MTRIASAIVALAAVSLLLATNVSGGRAVDVRWRVLVRLPGALDVVGPRADGRFVVAGREGLFLLRRNGSLAPIARGAGGYRPARGEAYLALARTTRVPGTRCSFRRDDVYALDPLDRPGVTVVDTRGRARRLLSFPAGHFLSGIGFDTVGRFGNRLLVTAVVSNRTTLYAIDCSGRARVVMRGGPRVEGGIGVAPATFGRFAGRLIAVSEFDGGIYAFDARGRVRLVARPRIAVGGDTGVESLGFVPPRFTRRGAAYLADFGAPGAPTSGNDSVLVLGGRGLVRAGVRSGDLVVASEGGGVTVAVRCARRCSMRRIGRALDTTHGEGHIAFARR